MRRHGAAVCISGLVGTVAAIAATGEPEPGLLAAASLALPGLVAAIVVLVAAGAVFSRREQPARRLASLITAMREDRPRSRRRDRRR